MKSPSAESASQFVAEPALPRRTKARALGVLYLSGGCLAVVWTLLPHFFDSGDDVTVAMALFAIVFGTVLITGVADNAPDLVLHLILGSIQVVIAIAYLAEGAPSSDVALFFIWATPYAAFYFERWPAVAQFAWTAIVMATCLALMPVETHPRAPASFLMVIGTVCATGMLVLWAARTLRSAEERHRFQALHDPLTGLPNRLLFQQEATAALAAKETTTVAIAIIDLDRFKLINDTFGHQTGDQLLVVVAQRLQAALRPQDLVARMGGDEFAVLMRMPFSASEIEAVMASITRVWDQAILLGSVSAYPSGSIGIAFSAGGDSAGSLLRDADAALYQSKALSPGGWLIFDEQMRVQVARRLQLERHLRDAIDEQQLRLVYQPIVRLDSGATVGAEALLRWTSPDLGDVPPSEFIPVAEETGMISSIGDWVLTEGLAQLAQWRKSGLVADSFRLTINVAGPQLTNEFPTNLKRHLAAAGVPASALGLEITETAILRGPADAAQSLASLHALGLQLLLDDFGTGFSSLSHLQNFPLDVLKIDRSFVKDLPAEDVGITDAIMSLGNLLSFLVVAEGIETRAQSDALIALGCRFGQGYFFSRPIPAREFESRMADSVPWFAPN